MIDIRGTTWLDLHAAYIFERRTDTYLVDRYYLVCIVGTGVCSSLIFGKRFWTVSDEAVPSRVATWTLWTIADITLLTALVPLQVLPELAAHFLFFSRKKMFLLVCRTPYHPSCSHAGIRSELWLSWLPFQGRCMFRGS